MGNYNWIKAYYASQNDDCEHEIFVRQEVEESETFVDDKGNRYHISELDLTHSDYEPKIFNLSEVDANSIADHKAKIDEREYWRKLRGEIFASLRKDYHSDLDALNQTEYVVSRLYKQDQEFFKGK